MMHLSDSAKEMILGVLVVIIIATLFTLIGTTNEPESYLRYPIVGQRILDGTTVEMYHDLDGDLQEDVVVVYKWSEGKLIPVENQKP